MAADKKGKKSKTMGKKDLKRTKGGLLPAVKPLSLNDKWSPSLEIDGGGLIGKV